MANFKLIYQILSLLDKYLDYDEPDWSKLSAENFKVSENYTGQAREKRKIWHENHSVA